MLKKYNAFGYNDNGMITKTGDGIHHASPHGSPRNTLHISSSSINNNNSHEDVTNCAGMVVAAVSSITQSISSGGSTLPLTRPSPGKSGVNGNSSNHNSNNSTTSGVINNSHNLHHTHSYPFFILN